MESGAAKEGSLRAYAAVKKFAMNVNNEIAKIEMNRRWDAINSRIDRSSKGRFGPNDVFSVCSIFEFGIAIVYLFKKQTHGICFLKRYYYCYFKFASGLRLCRLSKTLIIGTQGRFRG